MSMTEVAKSQFTLIQQEYLNMLAAQDSDGLDAPARFISGRKIYTITATYSEESISEYIKADTADKVDPNLKKNPLISFEIKSELCLFKPKVDKKKPYEFTTAITKEKLIQEISVTDFQVEAFKANEKRKAKQTTLDLERSDIFEQEVFHQLNGKLKTERVRVVTTVTGGIGCIGLSAVTYREVESEIDTLPDVYCNPNTKEVTELPKGTRHDISPGKAVPLQSFTATTIETDK